MSVLKPETNMHVQGNWYTCTVYGFTMTQIVYYSKGESQKEIPMTKVFKTIAINRLYAKLIYANNRLNAN